MNLGIARRFTSAGVLTVQTCSLEITETKGISPVQVFDSAKISLLATPALGCIQSFSERWKP